ncbi:hypothetical protein ISCGN_029949 [Ixodes scapularis]
MPREVIVSDSKAAILKFAKGYISAPAQIILRAKPFNSFKSNVSLIWTPAHARLCGNELAHSTPRGYADPVGWRTQSQDHGARSQLQTHYFPNPSVPSHIYPSLYPPETLRPPV